ncbi:FAD-dependent oxidoreductase [Plantactinospora sp. GCM10030261]|uniref:FAD-dependent oxidoreductase n=1 Tax=Plantactinospora sp. GCM10030261 TaxID=3273420 RepID=UPI0036142CCE
MSTHLGNSAVVLGGSMAGLLAARVLAEAYPRVCVVDRDELTRHGLPRRGVPQGNHAHSLHGRGQQIVEELFPGFTEEVRAAGVPTGDLARMRWYVDGRRMLPADSGLTSITADRPVLESHVRDRVSALGNVRFVGGRDILGLVTTGTDRVTGVRVQDRADGTPEVIDADLVVDATGRGSRTPVWLEELGYRRPTEERVKIGLAYTTRHYRPLVDHFHGDQSINPVATPAHPRGAFFGRVGPDRCILSLTGVLGDQPPTDPAGFEAYARSLPIPDIADAIRDAEPLDEPVCFRFPASVRRRYEHLPAMPSGLLVLGDAVCSFNPVYGQGMIVSAMEARILRDHLSGGAEPNPRDFLRDIARVIDTPWDIAAGGDLSFPAVEGRRTPKVRLANAYMGRLQLAATRDAGITAAFMRVTGLVDPPPALMRPAMAWRVLRNGGRAAAPAAGQPRPPVNTYSR